MGVHANVQGGIPLKGKLQVPHRKTPPATLLKVKRRKLKPRPQKKALDPLAPLNEQVLPKRSLIKVKRKSKPKSKKIPVCPLAPASARTLLAEYASSSTPHVVGVDMSLTNPGVCYLNLHRRSATFYFVRNRQSEHTSQRLMVHDPQSPFCGWSLQFVCFEAKAEASTTPKLLRYSTRIQQVLSSMPVNCLVGIEGYSFDARNTQATTVLCELGGILRWMLELSDRKFCEIPPSSAKKVFSGSGKANKDKMLEAWKEQWGLPCPYALIGLEASKYEHVVHPVEDVVDALAIALTAMHVYFKPVPPAQKKN